MTFDYVPLIERFGYLATFTGTLLEGETLLILSGLVAHRGYLSFPLVVGAGALGGALGDLVFFLLGRYYGERLLGRFPGLAPARARVQAMVERRPLLAVIFVRFMYGLRTAGPAIIGMSHLPLARFVLANVAGAVLWSGCWAGLGYALGEAAQRLLGDVASYERELLIGAAILAVLIAVAMHVWHTRLRPAR